MPLGELTIYHITEQELDQLESGTPDSIYFSSGIALLSTGFSFLIALLTAGIQSQRLFDVFLIVTLVGVIGGFLLLLVWFKSRRSTSRITQLIRNRKLPEGEQPQS